MWTIVHFVEENCVGAVPKIWVQDNTCYWPPYTGFKLTKAISACENPILQIWSLHKILQLDNGRIYDILSKAKMKAVRAEDTSDLNSELEGKKTVPIKRKVSKNLNVAQDSSQSEEDTNNDEIHTASAILPTPPIPSSSHSTYVNREISNCMPCRPSTSSCRSFESMNKITNEKEMEKENTPSKYQMSNQNINAVPVLDNNFQKQVLRQLQIINLRQQQQSEDISLILQKLRGSEHDAIINDNDSESIFDMFKFPIEYVDELNKVEDFLSSKENANKFVQELQKIGGSNNKIMTKRIMMKLFTDEVAKMYSWIGRKGKNNFSILRIASQVLIAIQNSTNCSLAEVEANIKSWLVKSTERNKKKDPQQL